MIEISVIYEHDEWYIFYQSINSQVDSKLVQIVFKHVLDPQIFTLLLLKVHYATFMAYKRTWRQGSWYKE